MPRPIPNERYGADPAGELVSSNEAPADLNQLLAAVADAKVQYDEASRAKRTAGERLDSLREAVEERLTEMELRSVRGGTATHEVVVSLAEVTTVRATDRPRLVKYMRRAAPELLSVNFQTLQSWWKEEAPATVQKKPEDYGLTVTTDNQLRVTVRPKS